MQTAIIIPARYGSTRFVGKPLFEICGKSMIRRVWELASAVEGVDIVAVATDDERIAEHVKSFGGEVVMTPVDCKNGSERVFEAAKELGKRHGNVPEFVINLQGDSPLTPPWVIQPLVDELKADTGVQVVTPAVKIGYDLVDKLAAAKAAGEVGGTCVVVDKSGDALYFSKAVLPFLRKRPEECPVRKHVGIYGYRFGALEEYMGLPECELERVEGLEQLRYLFNGLPIKVVDVDFKGRTSWGVDSKEDAARVAEVIEREGEIV